MSLNLTKEQQLLILGLIASIIIGFGVMLFRQSFPQRSDEVVIEEPNKMEEAVEAQILVHVCGAVRREGVYKLKPGDRLLAAIKLAGGALPQADLSAVNLAEPVKDGVQIKVPGKLISAKEIKTGQPAINLNTASVEDLDSLPGVGKSTAEKIVEYRRQNGPFTRIEQIMEIPRFGKAKYEKIKGNIVI